MRVPGPLINLALALASAAVGAAAIEGAARAWVSHGSSGQRTVGILSRYDPLLGWAPPEGQSAWLHEEEFDAWLEINSLGLRGPERGHDKPAGVHRLLLLGDSFAEGYTVAEGDTVRAVLEGLLGRRGCGVWQVLNAGVAGYSTDQEYLYYLEEGRLYGAEQVVLLFFGNDLSGNARERKKPYFDLVGGRLVRRNVPVPLEGRPLLRPRPDAAWAEPWHGSLALELLGRRTSRGNPDLNRVLARFGLVRPLEDHAPTRDWLSAYGPDTPDTTLMWERTVALLAALSAAVRDDGARLSIVYVPARFELSSEEWRLTRSRWSLEGPEWRSDRVYRRLYEACERLDIAFVDLSEPLRAAQRSEAPAYLRYDPHWNARGHAIAAQAIADALAGVRVTCGNAVTSSTSGDGSRRSDHDGSP